MSPRTTITFSTSTDNFWARGPARCDPYYHGQYNAYDITKLVKPGANVFAAIGHWHGTWNNSGINAQPAFLLEAHLTYPDGSSATIGTDESWKVLAQTAFIESDAAYFSDNGRRPATQSDSARPTASAADLDDPRWASETVVIRSGPQTTFIPSGKAPGSRNRAAIQFDSRREPAGWQMPGFDDSNWAVRHGRGPVRLSLVRANGAGWKTNRPNSSR